MGFKFNPLTGNLDLAGGSQPFVGWAYQDFSAINTTTFALTAQENGTNTTFDTTRIVSNSAVIVRKDNPDSLAYTGLTRLFSTKVYVDSNTTDAVTVNALPNATWGDLRVYYLYQFPGAYPRSYELAPEYIRNTRLTELDNLFVTEEELDVSFNYTNTGSYSTRFSETVTASTLSEAIDQIFKFTAVNPSTSISLNPSATREKGNTLASIIISGTTVRGQNPTANITSVLFKRGGSTIYTVPSPIAAGGSETYTENTAVTDTTTFSINITDATARTGSASATITFLYPILHLVGAQGLTGAQIYAGATKILSSTKGRTLSYTTSNQVAYYAFPASISALTSIKDGNGYEVIADWTYTASVSITGLDGSAQAYRVYEFKNITTATQSYTFA